MLTFLYLRAEQVQWVLLADQEMLEQMLVRLLMFLFEVSVFLNVQLSMSPISRCSQLTLETRTLKYHLDTKKKTVFVKRRQTIYNS